MGFLSNILKILTESSNSGPRENLYKATYSYKDDAGKKRYATESIKAYNKTEAINKLVMKYGISLKIQKIKFVERL
ncbi:hypothetical protein R4K92_02495 [Brachyspira intermedia]|uniref:hypothetical protein n=1 Tax=Brachyspira intermedia TaxID=84377 RepID=UPI00300423AD